MGNEKNMIICDESKCFGCGLCHDVCPVGAICISKESGFYRPIIDLDKCIECGKCKKCCPSLIMKVQKKLDENAECYAAYSKDDKAHFEAASGGIAGTISKKFVELGGCVVGAWWNSVAGQVEHRLCNDVDELKHISKSKYVQSNMTGIYNLVKESLKEKDCLFIGIPCQVNAMRNFYNSIATTVPKKMYFIDLLCRGGASPRCLKEHLDYVAKGNKATGISFRGGEYDCNLVVYSEGEMIYRGPQYIDPYFNYFMEHVLFQEVCYECPFAGKERMGDITLGDFWGLDSEYLPKQGGHGINMVFINSDNGKKLYRMINDDIWSFERPRVEAIAGNDTLRVPTEIPANYYEFWEGVREQGFKKALDIFGKNDYVNRYQKSIKYVKREDRILLLQRKFYVVYRVLRWLKHKMQTFLR